jgi:hypothetical protein
MDEIEWLAEPFEQHRPGCGRWSIVTLRVEVGRRAVAAHGVDATPPAEAAVES